MRIKLNLFFILFLFISFISGWLEQSLILFVSVLLHEMGHVFAAKKMKIQVYDVELLPYGGVARMEDISKYGGYTEAIVAAAGPVTSGIIGLCCFFLSDYSYFFDLCASYNFILFAFNLLPVHPLDGGRIARNAMIFFMGYRQATRILATVGRIMAIVLLAYNTYLLARGSRSVALIITAVFIYIGTIKEERFTSYYYLLMRNNRKTMQIQKGDIKKRFIKAHEDVKIRLIINQLSPVTFCYVSVLDCNGRMIKVLNEDEVIEGFMEYGYEGTIGQIIRGQV